MATLKRVRPGVVPPEWSVYLDDGVTKVTGQSQSDLFDKASGMSLALKLPITGLAQRIVDTVCEKFPRACVEFNADVFDQSKTSHVSHQERLIDKIAQNLSLVIEAKDKTTVTTPEKAAERVSACQNCPNAVEWRNGCAACVSTVQRLSLIARSGSSLRASKSSVIATRACAIANFDLQTLAFLDKVKVQNAPSYCKAI